MAIALCQRDTSDMVEIDGVEALHSAPLPQNQVVPEEKFSSQRLSQMLGDQEEAPKPAVKKDDNYLLDMPQ